MPKSSNAFCLGGMVNVWASYQENSSAQRPALTIVNALQDLCLRKRGFEIGNTTSPVTLCIFAGDYDLPYSKPTLSKI
ncbi:MAG: hypothetical protein IPH28_25340 [Cytophagaceae bacterium]|nr:hypothetical protein [Cytophagaceae bacterium]